MHSKLNASGSRQNPSVPKEQIMLQITTDNEILIDGKRTGLGLWQKATGTVVYTRESGTAKYAEHAMPRARYSAAHPSPASGLPGCNQLEDDVRALIKTL